MVSSLIPYVLFTTSSLLQGNLSTGVTNACIETATSLKFTNGRVFPRLAGFNATYDQSRPFFGPTGLEIAENETTLTSSTLVRSLWDAKVGCLSSTSKLWSGLNDSVTFSVNTNVSESPGPHCDGYYSNTTLIPPFLPWTSSHPFDGSSVMSCDSTSVGWSVSRESGMTCDNSLQVLCVFDPYPSTVSIALYNLPSHEVIGTKEQSTAKCDSVCLSSERSVALLYYPGETERFPGDMLYKNGMTGATSVVRSSRAASERVELFPSFDQVNVTVLQSITSSFFTGQLGNNCNNFTTRSYCSSQVSTTLNFDDSLSSCGDIEPNVLCVCYNEDWMTFTPTKSPSNSPTKSPSRAPTTSKPTTSPSKNPSRAPTTSTPTKNPTKAPV